MGGRKRALFLDRDGVVNVDIGYLHRAEDCVFMPGLFELVRRARRAGYEVFVVTNQAGIARGYYDERVFAAFTAWMLERFRAEGAPITAVYHCPHHPTAGLGEYKVACECRKPAPGMLLRAALEHDVDLRESVMVGDSITDMDAAGSAGITQRFLMGDSGRDGQCADCIRIARLDEVVARLHWR